MKKPFSDTFQSLATFALALAAAVGLIGWGLSQGFPALIASIAGAAFVILGLLWLSVVLARRHDGKY